MCLLENITSRLIYPNIYVMFHPCDAYTYIALLLKCHICIPYTLSLYSLHIPHACIYIKAHWRPISLDIHWPMSDIDLPSISMSNELTVKPIYWFKLPWAGNHLHGCRSAGDSTSKPGWADKTGKRWAICHKKQLSGQGS